MEPTAGQGRAVAAWLWDEAVRGQSQHRHGDLRAWDRFRELQWNYYSDPEPDPGDQPSPLRDQLRWMDEAGLDEVDVHWMTAGHAIFAGYRLAARPVSRTRSPGPGGARDRS